jgi:histone H3/H4
MIRALVELRALAGQRVENRQMKATALRVVQRLMSRELVDGFERWRDSVVEQAEELAKQQLEEAANETQEHGGG